MNSRSQAGLEYLMTYGWALVLIVSVASVLFFVMKSPEDTFVCRSSDPTKIIVESYNLPYSSIRSTSGLCGINLDCAYWGASIYGEGDLPSTLVLTNATGGPISIIDVGYFYSSEIVGGCTYGKGLLPWPDYSAITPATPVNLASGQKFELGSKDTPSKTFMLYMFARFTSNGCRISDYPYPLTFSFPVEYIDQFGYDKNVAITCTGLPPKT
ncbi:MAG: hypothetical protein JW772_00010 [Candidatus Diapherotrites archaeon]|nr:hypothetical protein [Candidatus Diapherotrites archaeon]